MSPVWMETFSQLTPEAAILITLIWVLLSDLFLTKSARGLWTQALLGSSAAFLASLSLLGMETPAQQLHPAVAGVLICTPLTTLLKAAVLLLTTLALTFSYNSFKEARENAGEFYALLLFSTLGALLCISSQDLLLFFISFELLSLPLYMLCAFRRYHAESAEAGLKYFINGALSSALLLYGISWVYGSVGSTQLPEVADRYTSLGGTPQGLLVGCLLILVGLAFKVSAAPFHSWAPDVYTGAPAAVSIYLGTAPKVAMIGFILRFFWAYLDRSGGSFHLSWDWIWLFIMLSTVSMFVGNLSALPQRDLRKILAYSGIAQIGYVLMGLAGCSEFNPHPEQALAAVVFYVIVYGLANLGAWAVVAQLARRHENLTLDSLRGLHRRSPLLAACLALCVMSLAGVPPLAGFVGKFYLFRAIYASKLPFLVVLGILNSVISLFYYFRVLKAAYFVEAEEDGSTPLTLPLLQRLAIHVCLWANVVLGLWPGLMHVVEATVRTF